MTHADDPTDRIAREAARLLELGEVETIAGAIRTARQRLDLEWAAAPGTGRVRQHVQGMAMQALGDVGYRRSVRGFLEIAEHLMTGLSEALEGSTPLLVGRAARGQVDGPTTIHVRIYTKAPLAALAQTVVDLGYDEPQFETVNTRHGRLNRLRFDEEGEAVVLTRCLPAMRAAADRNLFTGEKIATATLEQVRGRMEEL